MGEGEMMSFKKDKTSEFIGIQLSRFKNGVTYIALIMSMITAGMLFMGQMGWSIGMIILGFIPISILATYFLGYMLDKSGVNTAEKTKDIEMTHRVLNIADTKQQEFHIMKMRCYFEAKGWDSKIIDGNYKEYRRGWGR